jgi:hypothetical protein
MKGIKNRTPSRILYYQKDNNNNPRKKKALKVGEGLKTFF